MREKKPTPGRDDPREPANGPAVGPAWDGRDGLLLLGIMLCGMALCYGYASRTFMPLDQSIVFDGGWRIMSGQVPFRDFSAPSGLVPSVIQAGFFRLLGVHWTAYCLHSALFNGLFGVLAYVFIRLLGGTRVIASVGGLFSTVVGYTPMGTPYPDQHAFIFSFALLTVGALAAQTTSARMRLIAAGSMPVLAAAAFLSKQVPSFYLFPLALYFLWSRRGERYLLRGLTLGSALTAGVLLLWVAVARPDPRWMVQSLWVLPSRIGFERFAVWLDPVAPLELVRRLLVLALFTPMVIGVAGPVLLIKGLRARRAGGMTAREGTNRVRQSLVALYLLAVCVLYAATANIFWANNYPYLFVGLALIAAAVQGEGRLRNPSGPMLTRKRWIALLVLAGLALQDANAFHQTVNIPRGIGAASAKSSDQPLRIPELRPLHWTIPAGYEASQEDFEGLYAFMRSHRENMLLIGDASVLYGVTGKPSITPSLWFHEGLTYPRPGEPGFAEYEERLLARIRRENVRWIIIEGERTWMGASLAQFPRVRALTQADRGPAWKSGPLVVYPLNPQP